GRGGGEKRDGTAAAVGGGGAAALVEVADQQHDALVLGGQLGQGQQGLTHTDVAGELDTGMQESRDGVQDHQVGAGLGENPVQLRHVRGHPQRQPAGAAFAVQDKDALQVGPQGAEPGRDGVLLTVFAVDDDGVGRAGAGAVVGEGPTGAEAGAQVQGYQGFAQAGVAVEDGQLAQGQA